MLKPELLEAVLKRWGEEKRPTIEMLDQYPIVDLDWYLDDKIVRAADHDRLLDNIRALKYALFFSEAGAKVAFIREKQGKTPDLMVDAAEGSFWVEVTKFEAREIPSKYPASKVFDKVVEKRAQLPDDQIGIVAIDNFDILGIEGDEEYGFTHRHIEDALAELERKVTEYPSGWRTPSGVILAVGTSFGSNAEVAFPHFVWMNPSSRPRVPQALQDWLCASLPDAELVKFPAVGRNIETAVETS